MLLVVYQSHPYPPPRAIVALSRDIIIGGRAVPPIRGHESLVVILPRILILLEITAHVRTPNVRAHVIGVRTRQQRIPPPRRHAIHVLAPHER